MSSTALGIPYPQSTDDVNPPADLQALAVAVNTLLTSLFNPPKARIHCSATQSIANVTPTVMTMDTTDFDTDTMADLANNQLVISTAGTYMISGEICWTSNATGYREALLYAGPGATTLVAVDMRITTGAAVPTTQAVTAVVQLNVGDVIQLKGAQASTAALVSVSANGAPSLSAIRIGP
jgi:hypothetical protein